MSSPELELSQDEKKVIEFRNEWLRSAGWTRRNAAIIASDLDIDWHFAYDLRKSCGDEDLCMRIIYGNG